MAPTVWTAQRKWMGNLVPALFWLAPTAVGIAVVVVRREINPLGVGLLVVGTVLGWLALNLFGFWQNLRMREQLRRILGGAVPDDAVFVGFTTPRYSGLLDAHEDVGFLVFRKDSIEFRGEDRTVEVARTSIRGVRYRLNPHSLVGLGRWISIEAESAGQPLRMLVEPREHRTMLGNLRYGRILVARLREWAK